MPLTEPLVIVLLSICTETSQNDFDRNRILKCEESILQHIGSTA